MPRRRCRARPKGKTIFLTTFFVFSMDISLTFYVIFLSVFHVFSMCFCRGSQLRLARLSAFRERRALRRRRRRRESKALGGSSGAPAGAGAERGGPQGLREPLCSLGPSRFYRIKSNKYKNYIYYIYYNIFLYKCIAVSHYYMKKMRVSMRRRWSTARSPSCWTRAWPRWATRSPGASCSSGSCARRGPGRGRRDEKEKNRKMN